MLATLVRPFDDSEGRGCCGIGAFCRRGEVKSVADRSAAAERVLEGRFGHIAGIWGVLVGYGRKTATSAGIGGRQTTGTWKAAGVTLEGGVCTKKAAWQACVYQTSHVKGRQKRRCLASGDPVIRARVE